MFYKSNIVNINKPIHFRFFSSLFQVEVEFMFLTPDRVASVLHELFELLRGFEKTTTLTETRSKRTNTTHKHPEFLSNCIKHGKQLVFTRHFPIYIYIVLC